ncbi:MAG: tetratricopeptide repeat protein [Alphaproteobacteria bacterium]
MPPPYAWRLDRATGFADKPIMGNPNSKPQKLLVSGTALAETGRLKEAASAFRQATKADPDCAEAHFNLATVLSEIGKSSDAITAWGKVIALSPDIVAAHRTFGETLLDYEVPKFEATSDLQNTGPLNRAISEYRLAIDAIPVLRACHSNIGETYMNKGKLPEADKAFADAAALPDNLEDAFADVGATLNHPGNLKAAIAINREAMSMAPDYDSDEISEGSYLDTDLTFTENEILLPDGFEVMMEWERPIMERSAEIITVNSGDVLNVGFGMAIIDTAIQQFELNTHTIIEAHPQVIARAEEWAKDKKGVQIVPTRWQEALNEIGPFDGIYFDTLMPPMIPFMRETPKLLKPGGIFTFFQMMIQFENIEAMAETGLNFALERMPFDKVTQNRYYRLMEKDDQGRFTAPLLIYQK